MRTRTRKAGLLPLATVLVLAMAAGPSLAAEETTRAQRAFHLDGEFWSYLTKDSAGVLTAPFSWKGSDLLGAGLVTGACGLVYLFDGDTQDWVQARRSEGSDKVMSVFSEMGNAAYHVALVVGLYALGELAPSPGLRKTAVLGMESLAVTGAVVLSLKCLLGRARPGTGQGPHHFQPFSFRSSYFSLPSGHASSAFALATAIAEQSESAVLDVAVYTLAGAIALSRVHNNEHWASDVLLGAVLGHFIARRISVLNNNPEKNIALRLGLAPGGFSLSVRF